MRKLLFLIPLLFTLPTFSQRLSFEITKRIDSLFSKWNDDTPGGIVAVIRNDSAIYIKSYGLANMEYAVSNTPYTVYDIGSVSKQFTAFCVMLLVQQHKLNLNDDIHFYLPWLQIKDKVTIKQLLNHTSGIRDYFQLLAIAGKGEDDAFTQQLALHVLRGQRSLNNKPGDTFLYSNSNYLLLAEIIQKVSGRTLKEFSDSAIFVPLNMKSTHFIDDYTKIQANRAYSYKLTAGSYYIKAFATNADVGPGNIFSNIEDMTKWVGNFFKPLAGNETTLKMLTEKGRLNNGTDISYAAGINVSTYHGWKMYEHEGESAGFNTCVAIFPHLKLGIVVFTNSDKVNALGSTLSVSNLFLPSFEIQEQEASKKNQLSTYVDAREVKTYMGNATADDGAHGTFEWKEGKVYLKLNNNEQLLIPLKADLFYLASDSSKKYIFKTTASDARIVDQFWPNHSRRWYIKKEHESISDKDAQIFEGKYYCPELDCSYHIRFKQHQLWLSSNLYDETPMQSDGNSDLFTNFWWMRHVHILRIDKGIKGFEVNGNRVLKLKFIKVKT
jgi:CubicO group peptidase (beta-lactamase class C family)